MKLKQKIALIVLALILLVLYWQYEAYMAQVTRDDLVEVSLETSK